MISRKMKKRLKEAERQILSFGKSTLTIAEAQAVTSKSIADLIDRIQKIEALQAAKATESGECLPYFQ
jgi:hypothetical protein